MARRIQNWFSNMLPMENPLVVDGISYRTVENYFQAMRTADEAIRRQGEGHGNDTK